METERFPLKWTEERERELYMECELHFNLFIFSLSTGSILKKHPGALILCEFRITSDKKHFSGYSIIHSLAPLVKWSTTRKEQVE